MKTQLQPFDSQTARYEESFQLFLAHTDQKLTANRKLVQLIDTLPARRNFLDVGAGTGVLTAHLAPYFENSIAIEPNASFHREFLEKCPEVTLIPSTIEHAQIEEKADFLVCSHVLYYLDADSWPSLLARFCDLLSPQGVAVVILQNPLTDCMKMLKHFVGQSFHLREALDKLPATHRKRFDFKFELVESYISAPDLDTCLRISEFILSLVTASSPIYLEDIAAFLQRHFQQPDGSYRLSCHQDFLLIRPI